MTSPTSSNSSGEQTTVSLVNAEEVTRAESSSAASASTTMPAARLPRQCFVTTGSIASFRPLLEEVLSPRFLQALVDHDFDTLEVQCGPDLAWFQAQVDDRRQELPIKIEALSFAEDIRENMLQCRSEARVRHAGVVIGHAGSGTIMEALRYECPLIIVPNPSLLNNHQAEIAAHIASKDLAVVGQLGHIHEALPESRLQAAKHELARQLANKVPPPLSNASMDTTIDSLDQLDRNLALGCFQSG